MKIQIENNLYFESDEMQFLIKRYEVNQTGKNAGKERAVVIAYCPSPESAMNFLLKNKMLSSSATSFQELIDEISVYRRMIDSKFAPVV